MIYKYFQVEVEYENMDNSITRHPYKTLAYTHAKKLIKEKGVTRLVVMEIKEDVLID